MKNLIFGLLTGLALIAFTGCTNSSDAHVSKCQAGKCDGATKCSADKAKESVAKCQASGKCGQ